MFGSEASFVNMPSCECSLWRNSI